MGRHRRKPFTFITLISPPKHLVRSKLLPSFILSEAPGLPGAPTAAHCGPRRGRGPPRQVYALVSRGSRNKFPQTVV